MNEDDRPRFAAKGLKGWQNRVHGLKHWGLQPIPKHIWCGEEQPDEHDHYIAGTLATRPNCTSYLSDVTCKNCLRRMQEAREAERVVEDVSAEVGKWRP